jgi:hypothetical protein
MHQKPAGCHPGAIVFVDDARPASCSSSLER